MNVMNVLGQSSQVLNVIVHFKTRTNMYDTLKHRIIGDNSHLHAGVCYQNTIFLLSIENHPWYRMILPNAHFELAFEIAYAPQS